MRQTQQRHQITTFIDNVILPVTILRPTTADQQRHKKISAIMRLHRLQTWARQRQTDNATTSFSTIIRLYRSKTEARQRQTDITAYLCSSTTDNRQCRSINSLSICRIIADSAQLCLWDLLPAQQNLQDLLRVCYCCVQNFLDLLTSCYCCLHNLWNL